MYLFHLGILTNIQDVGYRYAEFNFKQLCALNVTTLLISVNGVLWRNFSKSTVTRAKMGHVSQTTPLSGRFIVRRLELTTIILYIKHEVATLTHYKDMKYDEKRKNWGGLEGWEYTKVIGNIAIR